MPAQGIEHAFQLASGYVDVIVLPDEGGVERSSSVSCGLDNALGFLAVEICGKSELTFEERAVLAYLCQEPRLHQVREVCRRTKRSLSGRSKSPARVDSFPKEG